MLPSKSLFLHLLLSCGDGGVGVGINKAAALLAVLQRGCLGAADARGCVFNFGTAGRVAIGVGDAPASDELGAVTRSYIAGPGVVRRQLAETDSGDCVYGFVSKGFGSRRDWRDSNTYGPGA